MHKSVNKSALTASCQGVRASKNGVFLTLTLWRIFHHFGQPFQRLAALYILLGNSLLSLGAELQRVALRTVGWLSGPSRVRLWYLHTRRWQVTLAGLLTLALVRSLVRLLRERFSAAHRRKAALETLMWRALDYEEWSDAAAALEQLEGPEHPKFSKMYDRRLVEARAKHLAAVRARGDVQEMMFAVRADLLRNLGNMCNSELHEFHARVPEPIQNYNAEVKAHLQYLTDYEGPELSLGDKLTFLRETRHAFGRTALVLSGGGALGAFHVGVVKALFTQNLLPKVLAGSSVGSIVAATVATRNDQELRELFDASNSFDLSFFSNSTASQFLRHFLLKGTLQDVEVLQKRLRRLLGDATFLQAFMHSGRILNVAVCPADTNEPPRVLNYLSAPNVVVWSAVSCSSAFPFLFMPQDLLARNNRGELVKFTFENMPQAERRWRDGSLEEDLPMRSLGEMFNVNYFLVSQTNPHIVPALNLKKRFNRKLGNLLEAEWKHRCQQLMNIWPSLRWMKVLSQCWEGDVTMVLPSSYMQIKKSVTNPTKQDLQDACLQGEQVTWTKLSAIRANCGIELSIDACLATLSDKARQQKLSGDSRRSSLLQASRSSMMRARTPSWLNLSAYGLPNIPSDEHLDKKVDLTVDATAMGQSGRQISKALSVSTLSDHMRAPGLSVGELQEDFGEGDAGLSAVEEADTPSPSDSYLGANSDDDPDTARSMSSSSESDAILRGLPRAPGNSFVDKPSGYLLSKAYSGSLPNPAFDCCDRSVNIWESLLPLTASNYHGQGLDVIAP